VLGEEFQALTTMVNAAMFDVYYVTTV